MFDALRNQKVLYSTEVLTSPWFLLLVFCGDVEANPGPVCGYQCPLRRCDTIANGRKTTNRKTSMTIVHLNARSLLHFDDVAALLSTHRPEVLTVSETWLDPSVGNSEIHIPGYSLFRSDRNRCGGGVAINCVDHMPYCVLSCESLLLVLSFFGFLSSLATFTLPLPLVASTVHLVLLPSLSMMFVTI